MTEKALKSGLKRIREQRKQLFSSKLLSQTQLAQANLLLVRQTQDLYDQYYNQGFRSGINCFSLGSEPNYTQILRNTISVFNESVYESLKGLLC